MDRKSEQRYFNQFIRMTKKNLIHHDIALHVYMYLCISTCLVYKLMSGILLFDWSTIWFYCTLWPQPVSARERQTYELLVNLDEQQTHPCPW